MESPELTAQSLPHDPGIYIYRDAAGTVIYVGKAKDLKRRVGQYFSRDDAVGTKTKALVSQIASIDTVQTQNEFDALLLEAQCIRKYNPKYNVISKDDKSPLYVAITFDEELPRIYCVRKTAMHPYRKRIYFGPFQSGRVIRKLLKQLRIIIPYCTQKIRNGVPCFYTHLGLCNPCASVIAKMEDGDDRSCLVELYRTHIRKIADIFSGKSLRVLHDLESDMQVAARTQHYEQAQSLKHAIFSMRQILSTHYDPQLYIESDAFAEFVYEEEMEALRLKLLPFYPTLQAIHRIECVDISNTGGTSAVGSLVVLEGGKPDPSSYKRFKIKSTSGPNDVAMIAEVVRRRLLHTEWAYPDLLVIDGGKGQVDAARREAATIALHIPIIGLAKRFEEIVVPSGNSWSAIRLPVHNKALHMIERLRDESHRFALQYHRFLRKKAFIPTPDV